VAIGLAGLTPLEDWRGLPDSVGRELHGTVIAVADKAAAAAEVSEATQHALMNSTCDPRESALCHGIRPCEPSANATRTRPAR
jgi:hypothetical protein